MKITFDYKGRKITRYPYKIEMDSYWIELMYQDDDPESYRRYEIPNFVIEEGTGTNEKDKYKRDISYRLDNWFQDLRAKYGKIDKEYVSSGGSTRYNISFIENGRTVRCFVADLGNSILFQGPTGNFTLDADLLKASLNDDLLPTFIQND